MGTFGWILLAGAFLVLIMVANNSWPWVWAKINAGIPKPGEGNTIVPTPPSPQEGGPPSLLPQPGDTGVPAEPTPGNSIVPTPASPSEGGPPSLLGHIQSAPAGTSFNPNFPSL